MKKEAELHRVEEFLRDSGDGGEALYERSGLHGRALHLSDELVDMPDPIPTNGPVARAGVENGREFADRPLAVVGQLAQGGNRGSEGAARDRGLAGRGGELGRDGLEMRRPRHGLFEVAPVARDGGTRRLGPDEDVRVLALAALRRQRARDVHQRIGLATEPPQAHGPVRRRSGRVAERRDQGLAG